MKPIILTRHALEQMAHRGASEAEVEEAVRTGEMAPAQKGRFAYRKNFPYRRAREGKWYDTKQVLPIVTEDPGGMVVVTVLVFYF